MEEKKKRIIVVLGMHRSGTSVITRSLQALGVHLGNTLVPPNKNNPKGFWEDRDINLINREMLDYLNLHWHSLTPLQREDVDALSRKGYLLRAVKLLRKKASSAPVFGFKDPRIAKLMPFWKMVFANEQFNVNYVLAIRNPLSVGKSLAERNGFDFEKSYLMWLGHVIVSLSTTEGKRRVMIDYDCLMQSPERELARLAKAFRLEVDEAELEKFMGEFLDHDLRHTIFTLNDLALPGAVPPLVQEVYATTLEAATDSLQIDDKTIRNKAKSWGNELSRLKSFLIYADKLESRLKEKGQALRKTVAQRDRQAAQRDRQATQRYGQVAQRDRQVPYFNTRLQEYIFNNTRKLVMVIKKPLELIVFPIFLYRLLRIKRDMQLIQRSGLFDREWYLAHNPDVARAKVDPARHYLRFGGFEGRDPCPDFDSNWYLDTNWDVRDAKMNPLVHYLKFGREEGRLANSHQPDALSVEPYTGPPYAGIRDQRIADQKQRRIDIVVCVHNALQDTRMCLASIQRARIGEHQRLIIIDDGSDAPTAQYVERFAAGEPWIKLHRNDQPLGYTHAANQGLASSAGDLVILLNSDTIVTDGWAEKMADAVFSTEGAGIVGPLSNAANYQSIPEIRGTANQTAINKLPPGLTAEDMNRYCEQWTVKDVLPRVPLVHGFCFGITREVLETVGFFDETNFPKGYGEENDYCFRTVDAGYSLVVATHTYVFHAKSKSFPENERVYLMKKSREPLKRLHGHQRIVRAVKSMEQNPILVNFRERAKDLTNSKQ